MYQTDDWPAAPPLHALLNNVWCMDALDLLRLLPDNSIDAIVTDPPYGLRFMGKQWDYDVPGVDVWREALRILKPGGHALIACGTRTQHRMAVNVEDGGFEIRDVIAWLYGSGFPKSLDVGKAIDREAGAERDVMGNRVADDIRGGNMHTANRGVRHITGITAPATDAARQWDGWGTALKPAMELWTLARKPLTGTVAQNVQAWGTGAINIDACRVDAETIIRKPPPNNRLTKAHMEMRPWMQRRVEEGLPLKAYFENTKGRFPSNVIHDGSDEVTRLFPVTGAARASTHNDGRIHTNESMRIYGARMGGNRNPNNSHNDNGGSAARFFYTAKASRDERGGDNIHPTVKPIALMRYLCRLITPPGGIVLDMFAGSGTTGLAAREEGFRFILGERDAEYVAIARARLAQPYTPPMFAA